MEITAKLNNYRQSPRKVRLVADLVRGKKATQAIEELGFLNKRASLAIKKLAQSAVANAKHNNNLKEEGLVIEKITVNSGPTLKRFRARARGRASAIKKRTSHIMITLKGENK